MDMKSYGGLVMALVALMLFAPVSAHEPKEYTILLKEEGITPHGVPQGILVSSDSLFFYNVDGRENVTHRILVDVEGDGAFDGVDDIATPWLSGNCELNQTGEKTDPSCEITSLLLLDPSNGLLPSNISMAHQVDVNGSVEENYFVVSFSEDNHILDQDLPIGGNEESHSDSGDEALLRLILTLSLAGMVFLLPKLLSSKA